MNIAISIIEENPVEWLALILSVIGGIIGLSQWVKGNDYKRAEIAKELIIQIRDDKEIAFVIDYIDWADGFTYDGKFHLNSEKKLLDSKDDQGLFVAIDRTLAHFNYICYLHSLKIFKEKDMSIFEYEIKRLFDNEHVCNYLYSLRLWSNSLGVSCSFNHLINYGMKKKYISKDFYNSNSQKYKCFLKI